MKRLVMITILLLSFASYWAVNTEAGPAYVRGGNIYVYLPAVVKEPIDIEREMVLVPAGEFQMGCDETNTTGSCSASQLPLHTVFLDAYRIDKYEITNGQFALFMNLRDGDFCSNEPCAAFDGPFDFENIHIVFDNGVYTVEPGFEQVPVGYVAWHGADAFCRETGGWLPTEAEWEKAARGSEDTRAYPWGDSAPNCSIANYAHSVNDNGFCVGNPVPVGNYPAGASPYGAQDMAGNSREWVSDWYDGDYYETSPYANPQGPLTGMFKSARGGYWGSSASGIRVSNRSSQFPTDQGHQFSFRCAASP